MELVWLTKRPKQSPADAGVVVMTKTAPHTPPKTRTGNAEEQATAAAVDT